MEKDPSILCLIFGKSLDSVVRNKGNHQSNTSSKEIIKAAKENIALLQRILHLQSINNALRSGVFVLRMWCLKQVNNKSIISHAPKKSI